MMQASAKVRWQQQQNHSMKLIGPPNVAWVPVPTKLCHAFKVVLYLNEVMACYPKLGVVTFSFVHGPFYDHED